MRPAYARMAVVTLKSPFSGETTCFVPNTLIFGSSMAVLCYNLVSRVARSIYACFFGVPMVSFYDDFCGLTLSRSASMLALEGFKFMNFCIGLKCKDEEDDLGEEITFLGLDLLGGNGPVKIALPEEKRFSYIKSLERILKQGTCAPNEAASLAGKLNFATTTLWGASSQGIHHTILQTV